MLYNSRTHAKYLVKRRPIALTNYLGILGALAWDLFGIDYAPQGGAS